MTATDDPITALDRPDAVHHLAGVLADRTHVVVTVPPTLAGTLVERLAPIADRWFLDGGSPVVGITTLAEVAALTCLTAALSGLAPGVVATIPKRVPAVSIRAAVGDAYPADGSCDIVTMTDADDHRTMWPTILVDAIAEHDPVAASSIYAADITRQS